MQQKEKVKPQLNIQTRQYKPLDKYDLSEIPEHMRKDIKDLIERKVEERVLHEMDYLKQEAHQALEFSRRGTYQNVNYRGNKYAFADWLQYHGQHQQYAGYGGPHNYPY